MLGLRGPDLARGPEVARPNGTSKEIKATSIIVVCL